MKIVGQQPNPVPSAPAAKETKKPAHGASSGRSADDGRVEISSLARTLQKLRAEVGDVEAVDHERVAQLRAALADGSYDPSPSAIADSLLRELAANRLV